MQEHPFRNTDGGHSSLRMRFHRPIDSEEDTKLQIRYPRLTHPLAVSESALGGASGADKMVSEVVVSAHIREITIQAISAAGAALILSEES